MATNIESHQAGPPSADDWRRAASLEDLRAEGRLLCRLAGKQIAVFETGSGILACNNRCPHEGYPLMEGTLDANCSLTCNWHNWKFNLQSGDNLYGGDRLRTYPVEVRNEDIWIDIAEPPFAVRHREILESLRGAFCDNSYDRMARELARLSQLGADPFDALREAIGWSWDRMEFGWTHAYAGMADWLQLYDEYPDDAERRLVCLLESVAHIADDVLRENRFLFTDESSAWDEDRFVEAIETEDEPAAVAMVRGALQGGATFGDLERGLTRAALLHYNDFGHSLIYVTKAGRLIDQLGSDVAESLLLSLVREIVFATREDRIPEFRGYARALQRWKPMNGIDGLPHMTDWRKRGIESALELTVSHSAAQPLELYYALLGANAVNLLAFDITQQEKSHVPVSGNVGWLDFTHGITFANAVRAQCTKYPELWPQGLLQMACFTGRNAAFTEAEPDLETWRVADSDVFFADAVERLFDHGLGEFIVSVHLVKTTLAARDELRRGVPDDVGEAIAAGLNRFMNSPLRRRQSRRTAYQAMKFVARE